MYIVRVKNLISYEYIYLIPMSLSAIISVKAFIGRHKNFFKLFSVLLLLTIVVESFAISWKLFLNKTSFWNYGPSNLWIYNAFLIVRYALTIAFIYYLIKTIRGKTIILYSSILFISLAIINYIFVQTPYAVNSYSIIIFNIILVIATLIYFKQLLDDLEIVKLVTIPEMWICLGILLYYSGTLPFFILFNSLINNYTALLNSFLIINDSLNIVMYALYLIGFLCLRSTAK